MVEKSSTFFSLLNSGICLHEKDRVPLSPSSPPLRTLCRDNRRVNTFSFVTICGDWSCLQKERRMKSLLSVFKVLFNGKNIIIRTHDYGKDKFTIRTTWTESLANLHLKTDFLGRCNSNPLTWKISTFDYLIRINFVFNILSSHCRLSKKRESFALLKLAIPSLNWNITAK